MENSKGTIEERVKFLISDKLGADLSEVTGEAELGDHLGADSLDTVEIIMELEKEFQIVIEDEIAENLTTVQHHIDIVEKLYVEDIEVDLSNENTEVRIDGFKLLKESKELTWGEIKEILDKATPDQLQSKALIWNKEQGGILSEFYEATENHINPSGEGVEPVSIYKDDEDLDVSEEPIVIQKGDFLAVY